MFESKYEKAVRFGLLKYPNANIEIFGRSGRNKSYVIDTRGAGSNIPLRLLIIKELIHCFKTIHPKATIGGVSKSGTVWAAWMAQKLNLPFVNILPEPRKSGFERAVEGNVENKKVILVDNWIRSGKSIVKAAKKVQNAGGEIVGVITIARPKSIPVKFKFPHKYIWEVSKLEHTYKFNKKRIKNENNKI